MRRLLLALACLMTLLVAQNGLAIAPAPMTESTLAHIALGADETRSAARLASGADTPAPSTMALLFAGLAGLTIAGTRRVEGSPEIDPAG